MTNVSNRTREKAAGKAGRFATEQHNESAVALTGGKPALTTREIEWARKLTGSAYADSSPDYYPTMDKAFDMALLVAAPDMDQALTEGMKDRYGRFHVEGFEPWQIEDFHKNARETTPGSKQWKELLNNYTEWGDVDRADLVELDTGLRESEAEALAEFNDKRRAELGDLKARIDAELAALEA